MKRLITIVLLGTAFVQAPVHAQDSAKQAAAKQISKSSEQADNLHGKKIQQQSLSVNQFEKLDTIAASKPVKKTHSKSRRKHH